MKKIATLPFHALIFILIIGCGSDDDNNSSSDENAQFTIGNAIYDLTVGYRSDTFQDAPNLFLTNLVLTGAGFSIDSNDELDGLGDLLLFEFYTSTSAGLQPGTYTLDDNNDDPQTVFVSIAVNYNTANDTASIEDEPINGTITIEELSSDTYRITGSGTTLDSQEPFTVEYTGRVSLIN